MENASVVLAAGGARAAGPGWRRRWRRVGVAALAVAAVAGVAYWFWLLYWSQKLFRALFLPGNLQLTLHVVEVGLLAALGVLLLARAGRRREVWVVGLPDGREIELHGATVLGSKAAVCDAVVDSTVVSRRHAELKPAAGGVSLRDLGSTNGTFVEGGDLRGRAAVALAAGDAFVLGDNGPSLSLARVPAPGLLSGPFWLPLLGLFLVSGLIVGFRGNLQRLPGEPIVVGQTAVDFAPFRELVPVLVVGLVLGLLLVGAGFAWRGRKGRRGRNELEGAAAACLLFIVAGAVALYSLLPAVGLRYARAAERAREEIGAPGWSTLESWERAGGKVLEVRRALLSGEGASEIPAELRTVARSRQELATVLGRYSDGRAALRWAVNLGARAGEPFLAVTYFLQALVLALVAALALVVPRLSPAWARVARSGLVRLARPLSPRFVRAADGGSRIARALRPLAYPDVLLGFAAAGLVAATLWSPFGSTLGRGKSLYLDLPGIPPLQVVELVKGLFVLFVAGYFARYGELLARTARPRYLVPFAAAAFGTLALTAVQADLGGLFMLALFLGIVFVVATGQLRLVAAVPALLVPGLALAWKLGHASIVGTRVGIWLAPRSAPLGEQLVEARQLLLSSGWAGHPPGRALAAEIPDIHGDLVIAALAERFGFVGVAALLIAGFVFVVSLLRAARRSERPAALLLVGLAALFLVQTLAQIGGTTGLLPLTGVPLPWLSHGLTASLVFTLLLGLAVAASAASAAGSGEVAGSAVGNAAERSHLSAHLRAFTWFAAGIALVLVAAVAWWTVALPAQRHIGPRGADYRWRDTRLEDEITRLIGAGVFVAAGDEARVRFDAGAVSRLLRAGVSGAAAQPVPDTAELGRLADGLRVRAGVIEALPWLVSRGNRFAVRGLPRGRVLTADGVAIALTDSRGRRLYPRGSGYFHPLGYAGGLTQGIGVEDAAGETLRGLGLSPALRLRMFAEDVQHGPDVVLTLDSRVQERAYELLAGRRGATVAIDLESGGLLALASSPSVAPMGAKADAWRDRVASSDQPLRDRAIDFTHDYSPPGSVFKIVMAAAILAGGSGVDPNERISCTGHDAELNISCAHGRAHGAVDLERALAVSCNIYFAHAAVALGEERIRAAARRLGFNAAVSLDLLRELPGAELLAARSTVLTDRAGRPLALRPRDLARVGYGQGPIDATPMDIARMGAVIASGGRAVEPVLAQALELSRPDAAGAAETVWQDEIAGSDGSDGKQVLPGLLAVQLQALLRGVFEHPEGTARRLPKLWHSAGRYQLATTAPGDEWEQVPVAGKTGSAWRSRSDSSDDAWMVVWAPAEGARVVVATLVEDAGEGGKVAGPIALEVLRLALERSAGAR